jgi:hypothetical protein
MSDLAKWHVQGSVRTLKTEVAEWDLSQAQWGAPRGLTSSVFHPDGNICESHHRNPDGSIAHWSWLYDESGRLMETKFWLNDGPPASDLYSYDNSGRHVRTEHVNRMQAKKAKNALERPISL